MDFSFGIPGLARVRANVFKQRGSLALALRILNCRIPTLEELGLPPVVAYLARRPAGLVLVTGPAGSGKSTTLAAMINLINKEKRVHIITLEDPIEYLHRHENSLVNQREVGQDTRCFARALRAALREDPDVIMVEEMRDLETISTAIAAAETGHLVLATLHTVSAVDTIDRIIDVFPGDQQQQVRVQLSQVLEGIICQLLLPPGGQEGEGPGDGDHGGHAGHPQPHPGGEDPPGAIPYPDRRPLGDADHGRFPGLPLQERAHHQGRAV